MIIHGLIQNFPDWCRHLHRRGLCIKNLSQQAKVWISGFTAKFCGDCVKKCEDIVTNFGENRPGCFTMTTHRLTLPFSPISFWRKTKFLLFPTHRTPLIWLLVTSSYFLKWIEAERTPVRYHWGDPGRNAEIAWHSDRKGFSGSVPKMEETVGPASTWGRELLREWRRPIGLMVRFMIFYSVSPENFGSTLV